MRGFMQVLNRLNFYFFLIDKVYIFTNQLIQILINLINVSIIKLCLI